MEYELIQRESRSQIDLKASITASLYENRKAQEENAQYLKEQRLFIIKDSVRQFKSQQ